MDIADAAKSEAFRLLNNASLSRGIDVFAHGILSDSWNGRLPSDHMPVLAALSPTCR